MPAKLIGFLNLIVYRYLKTFNIMAKYDLKFIDCFEGESFISAKKIDKYSDNSGIIEIEIIQNDFESYIYLDKSTAIKFAKTLRTEINKIQEVDNG